MLSASTRESEPKPWSTYLPPATSSLPAMRKKQARLDSACWMTPSTPCLGRPSMTPQSSSSVSTVRRTPALSARTHTHACHDEPQQPLPYARHACARAARSVRIYVGDDAILPSSSSFPSLIHAHYAVNAARGGTSTRCCHGWLTTR